MKAAERCHKREANFCFIIFFMFFFQRIFRKLPFFFFFLNFLNFHRRPLKVNPLLAAFYDAIVIYAWAHNRSLHLQENNLTHNEKIRKLLWNNVFTDGLKFENNLSTFT